MTQPALDSSNPSAPTARTTSGWRAWLDASLARRLTLGLVVALLVSAAALALLGLIVGHDAVQHEHEASATRMARLFEASLHNAMLKRDLAGMSDILAGLGQAPGVTSAKLAEPKGTVRFASVPSQIGGNALPQLEGMCVSAGCAPPLARLSWHAGPEGDRLQMAYPILNQARCAQCHGSTAEHPVNGVLLVDFKPIPPNTLSSRPVLLLAGVGFAALAMFAAIMRWTLQRQVTQPLAALAQASDRLAAGDLTTRVQSGARDELGRVAQSFDHMAERIDGMVGALRDQRQFLQTLIDAIPDPVLVIGPDHRIQLTNQAYCTLLQLPPDAAAGRCCHQVSRGLAEPCPSTLVTCPVAEMRSDPQPVRSMMALVRTDGSTVDVDIEAAPLVTAQGETLTVEVLRPLDRSLRFSQQQRLSTIGLLANGVAHEIHNPLASIRLALQASLRGLQSGDMARDELVEYLELVDHEIDRCVLITQRLMQMSQAPLQTLQPVVLASAIEDVLALLREEYRTRHVTVHVAGVRPTERVLGDEAELRQVLVNLIHNALHAMREGGRIDIDCSAASDGQTLQLGVRDNGCGISSDDQRLIFMPFFSRRADGQRGTGLGLAISKATMERFGGEIGVVSAPGQGSCFTLTFQRVIDSPGPNDHDGHAAPGASLEGMA